MPIAQLKKQKIKFNAESFIQYLLPLQTILLTTPALNSRGYRPLKMTFEDQLNALLFYHLQEHESARDLVQCMKEDDFAKNNIAPDGGISLSSFCEAINDRGLEQLQYVFEEL
ncbi:hypothetical protein SAMN02746065_1643, partial [Desulfocicer vacuolatum DSM 3385]